MRDCPNVEIRESLPDFARGALPEPARAAVVAHLEGCEACRGEVAVLRVVRGAYATPTVDVRRIVAALPPARVVPAAQPAGVVSLDAHRAARRPRAAFGGWRRAAAIVGVLLGGGVAYGVLRDEAPRSVAVAPPAATPGGSSTAPAEVAVAMPPAPRATAPATISLGGVAGELTTEEMELVLASLEEFDGVMAQEPAGELITLATEEGTR
jgi:anti-sigma factor RsiW